MRENRTSGSVGARRGDSPGYPTNTEVVAARGDLRGFANRMVSVAAAQAMDGRDRPEHDMHRVALVEKWPRRVRFASARAPGRPASTAALATARLEQTWLPLIHGRLQQAPFRTNRLF